ncbi:MAG TPA: ABC transporter permease subunit, partial [Roseiflexaceae bacterium]|nr:ABC transporter permease subunit [Roseiflexaceae bacterium]
MADEALDLQAQAPGRRLSVPFGIRLALWWCIWLGVLLFLFSGITFSLGILNIRTIALDWGFIAVWWPFISRGVIVTFELSIISMICAVTLALLAALARLSRVAPLNSLASLYVSLMRGTPLYLQFIFIYSALPQFGPRFVLAAFP